MFSIIIFSRGCSGRTALHDGGWSPARDVRWPEWNAIGLSSGGRELGEHGTSKFNGTWMDCPLGGREFGEYAASNGMGLDCFPGGRELGTLDASNGTRLDYLPGGREPGLPWAH